MFPNSFTWGVATAAYQVEGAVKKDGRGISIWDTYVHTPGKIEDKSTGDITCDQYHRYKEDVALMRELGIDAYRFSISWPRIFPQGKGSINQIGFDYYHRLIDELLQAGIEPFVTLYHWDLPQAFEDIGGWVNRETAKYFSEFALACYRELGSKVSSWITLNEPACVAFLGYEAGAQAPGRKDGNAAFHASHHLNLAHGLAVRAFRESGINGKIGAALNPPSPVPASDSPADLLAAERKRDKYARIYLDPMFGRGYPDSLYEAYPDRSIPVHDGDLDIISEKTNFVGLNLYFEEIVTYDETSPDFARTLKTDKPKTDMGWDVTPNIMHDTLSWFRDEYGDVPIYITENGCATKDSISADGQCNDLDRIDFLSQYLDSCKECINDGIDLRGYFLWSFIDNFEWSYGIAKRFGIVHCDYKTLKRTPKQSYYFYRDLIEECKDRK